MKKMKTIQMVLGLFLMVISLIAVNGSTEAADNASGPPAGMQAGAPGGGNAPGGAGGAPLTQLADSYVIDFLAPENAPDKTLYIKNPKGADISATWVDPQHGHQVLTNVSFDGEVLTFNALSGTPGDEYFYFHLELTGSYLIGYAKTQDMHKSPIVATPVKEGLPVMK